MASYNINPHSFSWIEGEVEEKDGSTIAEGYTTKVYLAGREVTFDNRGPSVMSSFMRSLVEERERCRGSLPMYTKSLKVLSNSVYGSLGYSTSRLYSPTWAASVTAVGRHCVSLSRQFFLKEGLTMVYTVSYMATGEGSREGVRNRVERALERLHTDMKLRPLYMIGTEIEECYAKGIMTDKKRYCIQLTDGSIKKAGLLLSRKDVSGLCRRAAEVTMEALFIEDRTRALKSISELLCAVFQIAVEGCLPLSDVFRYVKKDGISCYSCPEAGGGIKQVPQDEAVMESVVGGM